MGPGARVELVRARPPFLPLPRGRCTDHQSCAPSVDRLCPSVGPGGGRNDSLQCTHKPAKRFLFHF